MTQQPSLADRAVRVLMELQELDYLVTNDDPHRNDIRRMKNLADRILSDAFTQVAAIVDTATLLHERVEHERKPEGGR